MRNLQWTAALMVFCGTSACIAPEQDAEQPSVSVEERPNTGVSWEEYRDAAKAAANGGNYYRVEWDLAFPTEEALRAHYEETVLTDESKLAVLQQISTGFEPTYPRLDALDIVYCVSTAFSNHSVVVSDMAAATQAWRRVANVRFRYDSSQDSACDQNTASVDFAVVPGNVGWQGCGANKLLWPAFDKCPLTNFSGTAMGILLVQYSVIPGTNPASSGLTPTGVLMHELGHILGFQHEHVWQPGGGPCEAATNTTKDVTGRQLTVYDQTSVMHYPRCNGIAGADYHISVLDGRGARTIYRIPAAWHVPIGAIGS